MHRFKVGDRVIRVRGLCIGLRSGLVLLGLGLGLLGLGLVLGLVYRVRV